MAKAVALLSIAEGETVEVQFIGYDDNNINNISYIYKKLTILKSSIGEEAPCKELCGFDVGCLLTWTVEKYEKGKCTTSCFCNRKASPCCVIKGHTKHFGWLSIILGLMLFISAITTND